LGGGLFVGFSDHRRLFFLVLSVVFVFVFVITIVGVYGAVDRESARSAVAQSAGLAGKHPVLCQGS
jgi:hypothetical protein